MEQVDWHQVIVFKPNLRELTKNYVTKGARVLINGRLSYSEIISKEGSSRIVANVVADDIVCLMS